MHKLRNFLGIGLCVLTFSQCYPTIKSNQVCYKDHCFDVEVAKTQEDQVRGLQSRDDLDDNQGMLFIFTKSAKHTFWMKDTWIPLDIIWLDYARHVVHIQENVQPCYSDQCPVYMPELNALYVLEINAGKAREIDLNPGDKLEFRLKDY